jgi:hypothetical protein
MLLFAVIGAFGPTLFYQIYGSVRNPQPVIIALLMIKSTNSTATNALKFASMVSPSVTVADAITLKRLH